MVAAGWKFRNNSQWFSFRYGNASTDFLNRESDGIEMDGNPTNGPAVVQSKGRGASFRWATLDTDEEDNEAVTMCLADSGKG